MTGPETIIKAQIMEYLRRLPGAYFRVLQIAGFRGRTNQSKGMSDIVGCYRGTFVAIEVKADSKLSPEQAEFLEGIRRAGGIAMVAHSRDEVIEQLQPKREK